MASVNNNPHNSIEKTAAGQIAKKLDAADGKQSDGKIEISVWNKFWENNSNYGKAGKQEGKVIQGDTQTITLQQATDLIMTRLFNKFEQKYVNKKGAELLNNGNYDLTAQEADEADETEETEETEKFNNKTVERDENGKPYIENNGTKTYLKEYVDSDGNKQFITEEDFNKKIADAIGQKELPEGVTAELNANGEVVFKKDDKTISAEDVKNLLTPTTLPTPTPIPETKSREVLVQEFETQHPNAKQNKTRKVNGQDVKEYYKYKDSSGNTVRSILDDKGKEQKLVVILDSPVTNKVFVTEEKLNKEIGQTTLPKWVDYATCDKDGKMTFVTQGKAKKLMTAAEVKSEIAKESPIAERKKEKSKSAEIKPSLQAQATIDKFKAYPNVDVKQRIIDGKLQYYAIDNNGVRAVINDDGSTSPIVQIGSKKGKKVFVSLDKLQKAAKAANIKDAESLMEVPKGYECKVDEQGNVTLTKISNKENSKNDK